MDGGLALARRDEWAVSPFGTAELGDRRRTKRLVKLATKCSIAGGCRTRRRLRSTECVGGVELFYRAYKQTVEQRKLRSHSPRQAKWEWQMGMLALLGLMSVKGIIAEKEDPLSWSVAGALRIVRHAMHTSRH